MPSTVRSNSGIQVAWLLMAACLGAAVPTSAAEPLSSYDRVRVLKNPIDISDIELRNHEDEPFSITNLSGRPVFVFFGFTNCPDVCPSAMTRMQTFYKKYPELGSKIDFVLVSVDGERDSPAVMKDYVKLFASDFIGVTGDPAIVRRVATELRAPFYKGSPDPDDARKYSVAHSPAVFLIDADSRVRAELYNAPLESVAGILSDLLGGN